ncbi:hypothetical protein [Sphingomonas sp. Leaf25]|uniref:hypothetical protein n=1 Tax=Sphingomonas sp. Leaf25 TaxID=1735692 RepID=UPI000A4BF20E|nr:hypothetical protein [Sphingomonas sp. Leaf25]
MAPSLFLLLSVILAFTGGHAPWVVVATVVTAAASGTRLPDLDTPLNLNHRSALLHGVIPMLVALLDPRTWGVAAGLGFGIGLHLAADLFPGKMRGYATIKLPLLGSIGAGLSYLWIAANAAGNLIGGVLILPWIADDEALRGILAGVGLVGMFYLLTAKGGWAALALFGAIGWWWLG